MSNSMIPAEDEILLIDMGGTMSAERYKRTPVNITPMNVPIVQYELAAMGLSKNINYLPFRAKDSKLITDRDIEDLAEIIKKYHGKKIVISLGTDAMPRIARKLAELLKGTDKMVILTGAMVPLANSTRPPHLNMRFSPEDSDGRAALTFAVTGMENNEFKPGVHVVMRDRTGRPRLFEPKYVAKNFAKGYFYDSRESPAKG